MNNMTNDYVAMNKEKRKNLESNVEYMCKAGLSAEQIADMLGWPVSVIADVLVGITNRADDKANTENCTKTESEEK